MGCGPWTGIAILPWFWNPPKGGLHPGPLKAGVLSDTVTSPEVLINRGTVAEPSSDFSGANLPRPQLVSPFVSSYWEQGSPSAPSSPRRIPASPGAGGKLTRAQGSDSQIFVAAENPEKPPVILLLEVFPSYSPGQAPSRSLESELDIPSHPDSPPSRHFHPFSPAWLPIPGCRVSDALRVPGSPS